MQSADENELISYLDELRGAGSGIASRRIREALWSEPGHPLALAALGEVLREFGDLQTAVIALERAHYLDPQSIDILCRYGEALAEVGREREARLRFEAALRLQPGHRGAQDLLDSLAGAPARPQLQHSPRTAATTTPERERRPSIPSIPVSATPERDSRTAPHAYLPENLIDAEHPSGVFGMTRSVLQTWFTQPLLWVLPLAAVNALVAIVMGIDPGISPLITGPSWALLFAIILGPMLLAAANQFRYREPFPDECRPTPPRLARAIGLSLPYALLTLGGTSLALTFQTALNGETIVLAALFLTAPLHAALAPALVQAATIGPGGLAALRATPQWITRRAWSQLTAMYVVGLVGFALLAAVGLFFSREIQSAGELGMVVKVTALSVGESLWMVAIAVCGADSIDFQEDYLATTAPATGAYR